MDSQQETAILNEMPIRQVASLLGLDLRTDRLTRCPFPDHDDTNPSFRVRPQNRWICFGCQRRGGAIDFVRHYRGIEFMPAKRWLADHGNRLTTSTVTTQRSTTFHRFTDSSLSASERTTESLPDSDLYNTFLHRTPLLLSGKEYLRERGISDATISRFRIGQLPASRDFLVDLISKYGFERTKAAGLLTNVSTHANPRLIFPKRSLLFPFLENGKVAYIQARLLNQTDSFGRWRNLNGRQLRLYNIDAISMAKRKNVAICEGVIDTISAIELGYQAIGPCGCQHATKTG